MVFSSLQFIFLFLPIFFGCYYLAPKHLKNVVLLIGSLCFYFIGVLDNLEYFILFLVSIMVDFVIGLLIEQHVHYKKIFLIIGIVFHILCLAAFKYSNFVINELNTYVPSLNITFHLLLPIGVSFYTFQGMSYIIDIYKGTIASEKSLLKFAVYISMFAQLIAGPIVTYSQIKRGLYCRTIKRPAIIHGIGIFLFGLGLKTLLANPVGKLWSQVEAIGFESISTPLAWIAIFAFSIQIYFDFFGYSLMAIGLGKMLGFTLPKNFDFPYLSCSMTEFWRRWHITLGTWFRNYVYIPLGGNRSNTFVTIKNLLIVWILTGVWHGAGYNFILWGTILFLIILLEKFFIGNFLNNHSSIGHIYMILLIPLTWSVFAIEDIEQLKIFFTRLFPFFGQSAWSIFEYDYLKYLKLYYPFFIAGILFSLRFPYRILKQIKNPFIVGLMLAGIFAASVYCMYRGFDDPFLYFRF